MWFHVKDLSSAHIYLRWEIPSHKDQKANKKNLMELDANIVRQCAILTKANSISGSGLDRVVVNYTWASNLKKTGEMKEGAVGFHDNRLVMSCEVENDA